MEFGRDNMTASENKFMYISFALTLIVYFVLFGSKITVFEVLVYAFLTATFLKGLYDIKNRTGSKRFFCYSEATNQKLRYMALTVVGGFMLVAHKFLLCEKLKIFTCNF